MGRLKVVLGTVALSAVMLAGPTQAQPQFSDLPPEASAYRGLEVMREIDNRCPNLNFGERSTLNDLALGAMMRIPAIASSDIGELGPQAYFDRIDAVTAPIASEAKSAAIWAPCEEAPNILGRVKADLMVSVVAHIQKGREEFEANSTDLQKRMAANMIGALRQMSANGPAGALEQAVGAQMQRIDLTPAEAAQNARAFLSNYIISAGLAENGYTLRWSAPGEYWELIDLGTGERAGSQRYTDPINAAYYRLSGGEAEYFRTYDAQTRIIILPRKVKTFGGFIAFPLNAAEPLPPSAVALWPKYMSEQNTENSTIGCVPRAQCFTFSMDTRRLLESRADDNELYRGVQVAVYARHKDAEMVTPNQLNDRTRENPPPVDYLPLRKMFAE